MTKYQALKRRIEKLTGPSRPNRPKRITVRLESPEEIERLNNFDLDELDIDTGGLAWEDLLEDGCELVYLYQGQQYTDINELL